MLAAGMRLEVSTAGTHQEGDHRGERHELGRHGGAPAVRGQQVSQAGGLILVLRGGKRRRGRRGSRMGRLSERRKSSRRTGGCPELGPVLGREEHTADGTRLEEDGEKEEGEDPGCEKSQLPQQHVPRELAPAGQGQAGGRRVCGGCRGAEPLPHACTSHFPSLPALLPTPLPTI